MKPTAGFTLADFQQQLRQIRKLRSMGQVLKMIPGVGKLIERLGNVDPDHDMTRIDAMISSMTPWEREHPEQIGPDRQQRIAGGSGVERDRVAGFLSDFIAMSRLMVQMTGLGVLERQHAVKDLVHRRFLFGDPPSLQ